MDVPCLDVIETPRIVLIAPIFCPNDEMFERNYNSIKSYLEYCLEWNYIPFGIFGGYCTKPEYWQKLNELILKFSKVGIGTNSPYYRFKKNYGKAKVVNYLFSQFNLEFFQTNYNTKQDYFITCDSDILFDKSEPNIHERLVYAIRQLPEKMGKRVGLISLNQKQNGCHISSFVDQNTVSYPFFKSDIIEEFGYPNGVPQGIAGGCLFGSINTWRALGGYPELGVYSGDDGYLILKTYQMGYSVTMMKSLSIIHPFETNDEYQAWKHSQLKRCTGIAPSDMSKEYDIAEKFWKKFS